MPLFLNVEFYNGCAAEHNTFYQPLGHGIKNVKRFFYFSCFSFFYFTFAPSGMGRSGTTRVRVAASEAARSIPWDSTPRITAVSSWFEGAPYLQMSILRKPPWSDKCERNLFEIGDMAKGFGYCLTTYSFSGDYFGSIPPPFSGEPRLLPLEGRIDDIADKYWEHVLDPDNRVSLAVKFIPRDRSPSKIVIRNKYQKK